jgi:hypothetical protein
MVGYEYWKESQGFGMMSRLLRLGKSMLRYGAEVEEEYDAKEEEENSAVREEEIEVVAQGGDNIDGHCQ